MMLRRKKNRIQELVEEYHHLVRQDTAPGIDEFVARHPDDAEPLRQRLQEDMKLRRIITEAELSVLEDIEPVQLTEVQMDTARKEFQRRINLHRALTPVTVSLTRLARFKQFLQVGFKPLLQPVRITIVVAFILGGVVILLPVLLEIQGSHKESEAPTYLNSIRTCEEAYKLVNGTYINCVTSPRATPDENAVPWKDLGTGFSTIGFSSSRKVRFVYAVNQATETSYVAEALGDTNGDGNKILYVATESTVPHVIGTEDADLILTLGTHNDTED